MNASEDEGVTLHEREKLGRKSMNRMNNERTSPNVTL